MWYSPGSGRTQHLDRAATEGEPSPPGLNPGRNPSPQGLNPGGQDENSVWGRRDTNARVPRVDYLVREPISFAGFP